MNDIVIKDLYFKYEDKVIFDNFNATFKGNEINVLTGESGVGKTTLLNCIAGINKYKGSISGNDSVSYIFQQTRLINEISVFDNLNFILKKVYKDKNIRKEKIMTMLKLLEIDSLANKLPNQISGGEAQRVSLARAFLYPSNVLLIDEAFKEVDEELKEKLINSFIALWKQDKRTVIMVTHNLDEIKKFSDSIQILKGEPANIVK